MRQYEAANAIAYAGYKIELNPEPTAADISAGVSRKANPDYRIESVLFDCYSPEPPLVPEEQTRLEIFHEYQVGGESDYAREWEKDYVDPSRGGVRFQHLIDRRVRADIVEKVRNTIREKVPRQCLGVVLNLSDVARYLGARDVYQLILKRSISAELQHIIVIAPLEHAAERSPKLESVEPGQFLKYGGTAMTPYRPQFEYGQYLPNGLDVQMFGLRGRGAAFA